jgi:hypothetical protein
MRAYCGVTAHYIVRGKSSGNCSNSKGDLILRGSLIGFLPVPGRHCGQDLAKSLLYVTDRAGISAKVYFF